MAFQKIKEDASEKYPEPSVLNQYLSCFEEIITIPTLKDMLASNISKGHLPSMIDELITQCKVEYNIEQSNSLVPNGTRLFSNLANQRLTFAYLLFLYGLFLKCF